MNNRLWIIRTALISCIIGLGVYIHGRSERTVIERFHKISYGNENTLWRNHWLGIPTLQNPNDAWIIQEILAETKPAYIIEAGTHRGGSAVLWAMILREVNPTGKVITIDIEDKSEKARKLEIAQRMIRFIIGSSTDPKIVSEIAKEVHGKNVVVILDSDHSKAHVLKEMQSYAPLVNVGSYMIVQDSNINGHPVYSSYGEGPFEAIDAFMASNQQFQSDVNRERLLFTTNPRGYLKKIQ